MLSALTGMRVAGQASQAAPPVPERSPLPHAIARTQADRNNDWLSARDFGCVLDGVHDDTACLENATNDANGRAIHIPAGVLLVTRTLALKVSRYSWQGERNERGAHAYVATGGAYAGTVIKYQPAAMRTLAISGVTNAGAPVFATAAPHQLLPEEQITIANQVGAWAVLNSTWGPKILSATSFTIGQSTAQLPAWQGSLSVGVTQPMVKQYPPRNVSVQVGPYEHTDLTFLMQGGAHGLWFGDPALTQPECSGCTPIQGLTFGVSFKRCAFEGKTGSDNHVTDATGHLTRIGQTLIQIAEAFETVIEDVSSNGADIAVHLMSNDKPVMARCRLEAPVIAVLYEAGDLGVLGSVNDLQVEGPAIGSVITNSELSVVGLRSEYFGTSNASAPGKGRNDLTANYGYKAAVVAGSNVLSFSAPMDNIIFPFATSLRVFDATHSDNVFVTAVSGTQVTVQSGLFTFLWSNKAASIERLHGSAVTAYGTAHVAVVNASVTAYGGPAFVYAPDRNDFGMTIIGASDTVGGDASIVASANRTGNQFRMNQLMSFIGCDPQVIADPSHPLVYVDNWRGVTTGKQQSQPVEGAYDPNYRTRTGSRFDEFSQLKGIWVFSPKSSAAVPDNSNRISFTKLPGAGTGDSVWAWVLTPTDTLELADNTLPSNAAQVVRLRVRARAVSGTAAFSLQLVGAGGTPVGPVTVPDTWTNFDYTGSVPSNWGTGTYTAGKGIVLVSAGKTPLYVQGVSVELLDSASASLSLPFQNLPAFPVNGMSVYCSDCDPVTAVRQVCTSGGAKSGAQATRINGAWICQ